MPIHVGPIWLRRQTGLSVTPFGPTASKDAPANVVAKTILTSFPTRPSKSAARSDPTSPPAVETAEPRLARRRSPCRRLYGFPARSLPARVGSNPAGREGQSRRERVSEAEDARAPRSSWRTAAGESASARSARSARCLATRSPEPSDLERAMSSLSATQPRPGMGMTEAAYGSSRQHDPSSRMRGAYALTTTVVASSAAGRFGLTVTRTSSAPPAFVESTSPETPTAASARSSFTFSRFGGRAPRSSEENRGRAERSG